MFPLSKILIGIGVVFVLAGIVVAVGSRMGLGKLPGDISLRSGNTQIYIPIVTSIVVSIVLTVLLNLFSRMGR